eukprot:Skav220210  [mRNA]  locus=scaffold1600:3774:4484:- [translate_table: standard]
MGKPPPSAPRKSSVEPRLWLETVNADFDAPVSTEGWELAVLTHAMQKARTTQVIPSVSQGALWEEWFASWMAWATMLEADEMNVTLSVESCLGDLLQRLIDFHACCWAVVMG